MPIDRGVDKEGVACVYTTGKSTHRTRSTRHSKYKAAKNKAAKYKAAVYKSIRDPLRDEI